MTPLDDAQLRGHLARHAKQAADLHGLMPETSAQDALGDLVSRAADEVDAKDADQVARAEEAFSRLAATIAEQHAGEAGRREGAAARRVDARAVEAALVKLCPGFWPFC